MIHFSQLSKQYAERTVLDIPELNLKEGELVGLVGNNGAGKTTMMRLMLDLIQATTGVVTMEGKPVNEDATWKQFTGSYLDGSFLIEFYTPEEFFGFVAEAYGIPDDELKSRLERFETLMTGEILGTKKLIPDSSSSQITVAHLIQQMNEELGTTVLVSSHNLNSINDICRRIILLDKGKVYLDKEHVPGSQDAELEDYFFHAAQ